MPGRDISIPAWQVLLRHRPWCLEGKTSLALELDDAFLLDVEGVPECPAILAGKPGEAPGLGDAAAAHHVGDALSPITRDELVVHCLGTLDEGAVGADAEHCIAVNAPPQLRQVAFHGD